MAKSEKVYAACPHCGRVVLVSESDDTINRWVKFHLDDKGCVS